MARGLYREWFVRFRFPGHEGVRMVESAAGLVPAGWEVKALGDIAREVRRGVQPGQIDPETPYFGLEHLPRKSIALADWGTASQVQSTKLAFKKGEILFGKIRPYFHKVGVAPVDGVCSVGHHRDRAKGTRTFRHCSRLRLKRGVRHSCDHYFARHEDAENVMGSAGQVSNRCPARVLVETVQ